MVFHQKHEETLGSFFLMTHPIAVCSSVSALVIEVMLGRNLAVHVSFCSVAQLDFVVPIFCIQHIVLWLELRIQSQVMTNTNLDDES